MLNGQVPKRCAKYGSRYSKAPSHPTNLHKFRRDAIHTVANCNQKKTATNWNQKKLASSSTSPPFCHSLVLQPLPFSMAQVHSAVVPLSATTSKEMQAHACTKCPLHHGKHCVCGKCGKVCGKPDHMVSHLNTCKRAQEKPQPAAPHQAPRAAPRELGYFGWLITSADGDRTRHPSTSRCPFLGYGEAAACHWILQGTKSVPMMTKAGPIPLQVQHYMCTEETHKKPDASRFCRVNAWHPCLRDEVVHDPAQQPRMIYCLTCGCRHAGQTPGQVTFVGTSSFTGIPNWRPRWCIALPQRPYHILWPALKLLRTPCQMPRRCSA